MGEDEPGAGLEGRYRLPGKGRTFTDDLEALGFHTVGYGCTTCIGNSGPLREEIADAVTKAETSSAAAFFPATVTSRAVFIRWCR